MARKSEHAARLVRIIAATAALAVAIVPWFLVSEFDTTSTIYCAAATLAGLTGFLGTIMLNRGRTAAPTALWGAFGIFLALGIATLLSVGVLMLLVAGLLALAKIVTPGPAGKRETTVPYVMIPSVTFSVTMGLMLLSLSY